ncbi:MAG: hypothetical protein HC851_17340 [Acaryochloris sp. RU_4_1]|nr:hypothetical protein [Acaryochloris sp. RU_4_1]NJR55418.1 hypothetical protein [Acaryochloris sp. CRU_2_0]
MGKILAVINHPLTTAQEEELDEQIYLLKEIDPGLASALAECPGDHKELYDLAMRLYRLIQDNGYTKVIFPVGSPAFMWQFASLCTHRQEQFLGYHGGLGYAPDMEEQKFEVLFAHSERKSVQSIRPDGTVEKKTVFEHQFFF